MARLLNTKKIALDKENVNTRVAINLIPNFFCLNNNNYYSSQVYHRLRNDLKY